MKEYYINPTGTDDRLGPMAEDDLRKALDDGRYPWDSLVWCDGMATWTPAREVFAPPIPPLPGKNAPTRNEGPAGQRPQSHLVAAIVSAALWFVIFFPFCIMGIIAIVKDVQATSLWEKGRQQEAEITSNEAAKLANWGCGLLAIPALAFFGFCALAILT